MRPGTLWCACTSQASDPIHKATIIPRGGALGMVVSMPERDNYSYHRDKMYADLASVMGGRVAEEVIFGYDKVSSGASSDIKQATKLARAMVTQWGMSDTIGPLQYEEQQGETFLGYSQTQRHNMSNETALAIDGEIRRLGRWRSQARDRIDHRACRSASFDRRRAARIRDADRRRDQGVDRRQPDRPG